MGNEKIISEIWETLKTPLERNGLQWAEEQPLEIINPIKIKVEPDNSRASVEIDTKNLAKNPNVAWAALCDIEVSLYKKYGELKLYFWYDIRSISFKLAH